MLDCCSHRDGRCVVTVTPVAAGGVHARGSMKAMCLIVLCAQPHIYMLIEESGPLHMSMFLLLARAGRSKYHE